MTAGEIRIALGSADVEVRRDAVVAAGQLRDRAMGPAILDALADADWRVREEAVRVTTQLADELDLLGGLIDAVCQGSNVGLRTAAREVLQRLGARAARAVLTALPQVEPNARKFLLDTLICSGSDEVLSTLVDAVQGDDPMNAVSAMDALAIIGGERAQAALRERLRSGDTFLRAGALDALEKLGVCLPWAELEPLLEDRLLRRVALDALGRSADARAIVPLVAALEDRSTNVRARPVSGLHRLSSGDPLLRSTVTTWLRAQSTQVLEALVSFTHNDDLPVATAAWSILAGTRDVRAVGAALELLSRSLPLSELAAAFCDWPAAAASAALDVAAQDPLRRAAAFSLACAIVATAARRPASGATPEPMVEALLTRLRAAREDRDPGVQLAVLHALGEVGDTADAAALVVTAQSDHEELAQAAAAALRALASREPAAVRTALASAAVSGAASSTLAELIVTLQIPDALARLRAALLSDQPALRVSAILGLSLLDGESAAELIVLALSDEEPEVQVAAIDALPRLPAAHARQRAVDALLLFESADSDVQVALAGSLAALGDPRAVERLRKLARFGPPGVRVFAMQGLQGLSDPALDELLMESLGDADPEVVKQALTVLSAAPGPRTCARVAIALEHPAWDVRRLAASLLAEARESSAAPALRARLLLEHDDLVSAAIKDALAVLEAS